MRSRKWQQAAAATVFAILVALRVGGGVDQPKTAFFTSSEAVAGLSTSTQRADLLDDIADVIDDIIDALEGGEDKDPQPDPSEGGG